MNVRVYKYMCVYRVTEKNRGFEFKLLRVHNEIECYIYSMDVL